MGDASSLTEDKEKQVERMGLTPDWIIQVILILNYILGPTGANRLSIQKQCSRSEISLEKLETDVKTSDYTAMSVIPCRTSVCLGLLLLQSLGIYEEMLLLCAQALKGSKLHMLRYILG